MLSLLGCDTFRSAEGRWAGECAIDGSNPHDDPFLVEFSLLIDYDDGEVVSGSGEFSYGTETFSGKLHGERFDDDLELILDGAHDGESVRLEIEGELDSDRLLGDCAFYGVEGELKMSRTDTPK
jgi:hypothetical protein